MAHGGGVETGRRSTSTGRCLAVACALSLFAAIAAGATPDRSLAAAFPAGSLDPSFGTHGVVAYQLGFGSHPFSRLEAIVPTPGGKLAVAGYSGNGGGRFEVLTARLNENGSLDPSYGSGGWLNNEPTFDYYPAPGDQYANAEVVEANGSPIVGGNVIERLTPAGQLDPSFSPNLTHVVEIHALRMLPEGKLLVLGSQNPQTQEVPAEVERLLPNGQPDRSFGREGYVELPLRPSGSVYSSMAASGLLMLPDGSMLVSGAGRHVSGPKGNETGHEFLWLSRLTPSGAVDRSFGSSGFVYLDGAKGAGEMVADGNGLVLVGFSGNETEESSFRMTAWGLTLSGQPNPSFGEGGVSVIPANPGYNASTARAVTVDPSGRLVLTGHERAIGNEEINPPISVVVRLSPNGSPDRSFGSAGVAVAPQNTYFSSVTTDAQGRIVVAGTGEANEVETESAIVERFLSAETEEPGYELPSKEEPKGPVHEEKLASGGSDGCLILPSGHVECWGANRSGQLGNGTRVNSSAPVEVENVTDARDVSVGASAACAVLSDGHIDCWGDNSDGALGNGTRAFASEVPLEVHGITGAVQVSAGDNNACAVLANGHVDCWGAKRFEAIDSPTYIPREVKHVGNAVQVAVGGDHSCVLLATGHVECWEENNNGELGDGNIGRGSVVPVEVHGVTSASEIAAGNQHTCALLSNGHVVCWGDNSVGELGNGTTVTPAVPTEVAGIEHATRVAAGGVDSCALMSTARVECWGSNYYGQLGDGTIRSSDTPVEVHHLTGVAQLAAGWFACALSTSGSVRCWGADEGGQLGAGVNGGARDIPTAVYGLTGVVQAAVGWPHACAVMSSGQLDCWGENRFGELGDGTTERKEAPVAVPGLSGVVQVSARESFTCAVLASGRVDCWGGSYWEVGQLGNGTLGGSTTPVDVKNIATATQVATTNYGSCALLANGHVDCWGAGFGGSLGNGTHSETATVPVEVEHITNAVQITAGGEHFCALLADSHIDCWGGNGNGQIGNGTTNNAEVPVEVQGVTDATEVAAGRSHTCALLSSGHVDCWGQNTNGQLGVGTFYGPEACWEGLACSEHPIEVPGVAAAIGIAAGGNDSCALISQGRVACWGGDDSGQIGDGTFGPNGCENGFCERDKPTEVHGLTGATAVAVGGTADFGSLGTACAIASGGALECWGSNAGGVLGDDLAWSTTPLPIVGSPVGEPSGGSGGEEAGAVSGGGPASTPQAGGELSPSLALGGAAATTREGQASGGSPSEPSLPHACRRPAPANTSNTARSTTNAVACIGSRMIGLSLYSHWAKIAEHGGHARRKALIDEVMRFLISSYWVIGEAKDLGIQVSDALVRHRFDFIRRQQFPKSNEFKAFLGSSGETVADLLFRVRLNLLQQRIQRQLVSSQHSPHAQEGALEQFARVFKTKWSAQTYCLPAYAVSDCGHVQSVL